MTNHSKFDKILVGGKKLSCVSLWRNRLARSTVNRKVGGSSPPKDDPFLLHCYIILIERLKSRGYKMGTLSSF